MYEIVVETPGASRRSILPDGIFWLPKALAAASRVRGLALVANHAFAITAENILRLSQRNLEWPGYRLRWKRLAAPEHKRPLIFERTRKEESSEFVRRFALQWRQTTLPLTPLVFFVGRHPGADLCLADARTSELHCALYATEKGLKVVDLGSRNGTRIDGQRIREALITRRSELHIGRSTLLIRCDSTATQSITLPSTCMAEIHRIVERVAPANVPVLIGGESGVGKEHIARRLHRLSGRPGRLICLNAAVLGANLAASELFGHTQGAFTGATEERDGAFHAAHRGTLFLDEVAELPLPVQAELLRVVETGKVRRLGEAHELPVDVRLVTATHRDLLAQVQQGRFREDLFHRICVVPICLAPLRERPGDMLALANKFLSTMSPPRALSAAAMRHLRTYPWPGNVRELLNTLRRAALLSDHTCLRPEDIPLVKPRRTGVHDIDALIHDVVCETYSALQGDVAATARRLGLRTKVVYRHVKGAHTRS